MGQDVFRAGVHYNDFMGTAAADGLDRGGLKDYLLERKLIAEGEFLAGIEVSTAGQSRCVYAYVAHVASREALSVALDSELPLQVRKVPVEISLDDFFGLFKEFSICISPGGLVDEQPIQFQD